MASSNYIQIQIISRNMDFSKYGGSTTNVDSYAKLNSKKGIDLTSSNTKAYSQLPNAGTNETWYGIRYASISYYSQTAYAPFGVKNLKLNPAQEGLKFIIDLVHTETNGKGNNWDTTPFIRNSETYGKFIYSPFNDVINGWVSINEENILKVYVNTIDSNYFDQLTSPYRDQLFLQVIGHWEAATSTYNITNITTNCTGNNEQTTIEQGENYTNIFTPNTGYAFNDSNKPYAVCAGITYQSTLNDNGTAILTINNVSGNIEISGGAITKYSLNLELYNCVLYDGDNPYQLDYVLEGETYHFILHSNEGFIFKTSPTWSMGDDSGQFWLNPNDKTTVTINWNLYPYITISNNLSIQANATLSASLKYGFVSIYNPTYDEVDELSKKRFFSITQGEMLDLSQYIISFRKLYVDIPQIARELVYFGKYNTNVSSNIITTNFIETDCGQLTINELYNNSLDYNGVTIEIYLPFIGMITLNPNEVYNKTLHLIYRTNPLNGDCVAIIYSNNKQIAYSQGNVSFDIPINFKYGNLNDYGTNDNSLYMCDLTPYIEVITPKQYQNMNNRLLNNNLWVNLNECNGYCQFDEIELIPLNNINKDIYDEIITLLTQGVEF